MKREVLELLIKGIYVENDVFLKVLKITKSRFKEERNFIDFLKQQEPNNMDPSARYSVTVNIEVRFTRSKAKDALLAIQVTKDPNAPAIRLTEEQIRERYPWDYKTLTEKCRQRYADFKVNQEYHDIRKGLVADQRFAHVRRLDPDNPKSSRKVFYNPNILKELDKFYAR